MVLKKRKESKLRDGKLMSMLVGCGHEAVIDNRRK